MKHSNEAKRLLYSFEGLHTDLKDGRYAAYLCPAGKPTIYCGLTDGVKLGMVVTTEQGEAMFAKEAAKFEAVVTRLVTVPINQNEFDGLFLLSYNIGEANFAKSTALKRLNRGDRIGAAAAMEWFVKAKDPKSKIGRKRTLPGLVSRRKREAALFLKPVEKPTEPYMPQSVAAPSNPIVPAVTVGVGAPLAASSLMSVTPPVPQAVTDSLQNAEAWKGVGETIWTFKAWVHAQPTLAALLLIGVSVFWLWSKRKAAQ